MYESRKFIEVFCVDKNLLIKHGIDYDDGVKRLMGNSVVFEKCLMKFPSDESFAMLKAELEAGNCSEAFKYAHNLKGLAGNLSMVKLFASANECCEALRHGNIKDAKSLFPPVERDYNEAISALEVA